MTIAACYVSPEGIVFGADSTTTVMIPGNQHYFNHAQKLFQIGEGSTLAAVSWGLGGLGATSYRRLLAILSDDLISSPPASVAEAATRWSNLFWQEYSTTPDFIVLISEAQLLATKSAHDASAPLSPGMRTVAEESRLRELSVRPGSS